jgi:hypothetical protein
MRESSRWGIGELIGRRFAFVLGSGREELRAIRGRGIRWLAEAIGCMAARKANVVERSEVCYCLKALQKPGYELQAMRWRRDVVAKLKKGRGSSP